MEQVLWDRSFYRIPFSSHDKGRICSAIHLSVNKIQPQKSIIWFPDNIVLLGFRYDCSLSGTKCETTKTTSLAMKKLNYVRPNTSVVSKCFVFFCLIGQTLLTFCPSSNGQGKNKTKAITRKSSPGELIYGHTMAIRPMSLGNTLGSMGWYRKWDCVGKTHHVDPQLNFRAPV